MHVFIQHARENLGRVDSQNRIYCCFKRLLTGPTDLLLLVEAVNRPVGASLVRGAHQRSASWTWDVTHERALSPADLFGGKAPVGALIGLLERIR